MRTTAAILICSAVALLTRAAGAQELPTVTVESKIAGNHYLGSPDIDADLLAASIAAAVADSLGGISRFNFLGFKSAHDDSAGHPAGRLDLLIYERPSGVGHKHFIRLNLRIEESSLESMGLFDEQLFGAAADHFHYDPDELQRRILHRLNVILKDLDRQKQFIREHLSEITIARSVAPDTTARYVRVPIPRHSLGAADGSELKVKFRHVARIDPRGALGLRVVEPPRLAPDVVSTLCRTDMLEFSGQEVPSSMIIDEWASVATALQDLDSVDVSVHVLDYVPGTFGATADGLATSLSIETPSP